MASGGVKGYYRQKKSGIGKASSKTKASQKSSKISPKHSAILGSDHPQSTALISHGSPDLKDVYDENEEVLRQFDMNMMYGPCLGMTRLERWNRANGLGLNPPKEVEAVLREGKARLDCLWDGRV